MAQPKTQASQAQRCDLCLPVQALHRRGQRDQSSTADQPAGSGDRNTGEKKFLTFVWVMKLSVPGNFHPKTAVRNAINLDHLELDPGSMNKGWPVQTAV